jgi:spore maturation protein CgeB
MRILLFDSSAHYPSNPLFVEALREIAGQQNHSYDVVDAARLLAPPSLVARAAHRFLRRPLGYRALNRALQQQAQRLHPDIVLVCKGTFVSPAALASIKAATGAVLINYMTDDPFNPLASNRDLLRSIPLYDFYFCSTQEIADDVAARGCRNTIYLPFAYKPGVHFPEAPVTPEETGRFTSDVVFVGGGDEDRTPLLKTLLRAAPGLNLHLYGGYWNRDPVLAPYDRGFALGRDFRLALGASKIALNLVRRANRSGQNMRSFEIPACGGFMLADRTQEHLELFREGEEAAYFGSTDEMVDMILYYLDHEAEGRGIAEGGHRKVMGGNHTYAGRLSEILQVVERNREGERAQHNRRFMD